MSEIQQKVRSDTLILQKYTINCLICENLQFELILSLKIVKLLTCDITHIEQVHIIMRLIALLTLSLDTLQINVGL